MILRNYMQLIEPTIIRRSKKVKSSIDTDDLFSLALVKMLGKIEIDDKLIPLKVEKKDPPLNFADLSSWCMPVQPVGYIKCKNFDFL